MNEWMVAALVGGVAIGALTVAVFWALWMHEDQIARLKDRIRELERQGSKP